MSKQQRPRDVCAQCGQLREIVNVARILCDTCNHKRLRDAASREKDSDDHEISRKMRKEICRQRSVYAKFLNLCDDLNFRSDEKKTCKQIALKHLLAQVQVDLNEDGEFGEASGPVQ